MFSASFMSKHSRILHVVVLVGLVVAPGMARAQRTLTLDEALQTAHRNNRDLRAAKARVAQAHTGVQTAWAALLPVVTMQGKYTHNYKEVVLDLAAFAPGSQPIVIQPSEQLDFALQATIPLVVPYGYSAYAANKKSVAAAEANFSATEAQILFTTAQTFFAAAGNDELVQTRRHAIEVSRKTLDNAKARLEAGVVNRVEVTRAQLAVLRAEQAARESEDSRSRAYTSLRTLIQLPEEFHVVPQAVEAAPVDVKELARQALSLRPEFIAYQKTIEANSAFVTSTKWRWAPTLSGFGNLRAFNYKGFAGDNYAWALGVSLDWVIYDGGLREAQDMLYTAQRTENEWRYSQLKDTVLGDLDNDRRAVQTKRSALLTASRSVELAKETLDLVRVQHDAGTATQLDVLTAQDQLIGNEVAVAQARFDLALSDLQLRRTAGTFPGNAGSKQ
jgi:outer membrane protein TolC